MMIVTQHTSDETGKKMIFPASLCSWEQVDDTNRPDLPIRPSETDPFSLDK